MSVLDSASQRSLLFYLDCLEVGGVERIVLNLLQGLTERGWKVQLVLNEGKGPLLEAVPAGVPVHVLDVRHFPQAVLALARLVRRLRPDIVVSQRSYLNAIAVLATRSSGHSARLVLADHTLMSVEYEHPPEPIRPIDHVLRWLYPLLYRAADVAVAVSEGVARDLGRYFWLPRRRIRVLYNPIVPGNLDALVSEPVELPWPDDGKPLILAIGRLHADKAYDRLLRAFALVRRQEDCRLAFIGTGHLQPDLESLAKQLGVREYVFFLGFRSNPFAWLRHATVLALSSLAETFPTVLIEAMAVSVPVVSFDCPDGPREIVTDGHDGLLVPREDHAALALGILRILGDSALSARLVANGRHRALDFTFARTVGAYEVLFGSLIGQPVPAREERPA